MSLALPIIYMLSFPFLMGFLTTFNHATLIPIIIGTVCLITIAVISVHTPFTKMTIKTGEGRSVQRCWKCAGESAHVVHLIIVSGVAFAGLYVMEFTNMINSSSMLLVIVLSLACSAFMYAALYRAIHPETAKKCLH